MVTFSIVHFLISLVFGAWAYHLAKSHQKNPWIWFSLGCLLHIWAIIVLILLPTTSKSSPLAAKKDFLSMQESLFFETKENFRYMWYFLNENHQSEGAFSFQRFRELYESKKIQPLTYVWNTALPDWQRLKDIMKKSTS